MKVRKVVLDGIMTYSELRNGLLAGDFKNFEPGVKVEPLAGKFKGQLLPRFRQDHSSVTMGRNGKGYFVMVVGQEDIEAFPQILVREAIEAAAKMSATSDWGKTA